MAMLGLRLFCRDLAMSHNQCHCTLIPVSLIMGQTLTERYRDRLVGVLSCYDRIVITGTPPGACYAGGMTSFLYSRGVCIFVYFRI